MTREEVVFMEGKGEGSRSITRGLARDREVVGAERRGGEAGAVVEIARRVVGPAVAHRDGRGDLGGRYDDLGAVDFRLGPDPLAVGAADGEALEFARVVADERS